MRKNKRGLTLELLCTSCTFPTRRHPSGTPWSSTIALTALGCYGARLSAVILFSIEKLLLKQMLAQHIINHTSSFVKRYCSLSELFRVLSYPEVDALTDAFVTHHSTRARGPRTQDGRDRCRSRLRWCTDALTDAFITHYSTRARGPCIQS